MCTGEESTQLLPLPLSLSTSKPPHSLPSLQPTSLHTLLCTTPPLPPRPRNVGENPRRLARIFLGPYYYCRESTQMVSRVRRAGSPALRKEALFFSARCPSAAYSPRPTRLFRRSLRRPTTVLQRRDLRYQRILIPFGGLSSSFPGVTSISGTEHLSHSLALRRERSFRSLHSTGFPQSLAYVRVNRQTPIFGLFSPSFG